MPRLRGRPEGYADGTGGLRHLRRDRVRSRGGGNMRANQFLVRPELTGPHVRFLNDRKTAEPASVHRCKLVMQA